MKVGDKVLAEAEITQVCDGFVVVRFPKVGAHPVAYVRVTNDRLSKPRKAAHAD